jgi:formate dehydrogenase major subunit
MLTKLLVSDQPPRERDPKQTTTGDNELLALADRYGVTGDDTALPCGSGRRRRPVQPGHRGRPRLLHPVRPVRPGLRRHPGQRRDRAQRQGLRHPIAFDLSDPMGASSASRAGKCVAACPTGALTNKPIRTSRSGRAADSTPVDTVCPYCGVGCALTYYVDRERGAIAFADGPGAARISGPALRQGPVRLGTTPRRRSGLTDAADPREESYPKGALSADVRGDMAGGGEANDHGMTNDGDPKQKRKGGSAAASPAASSTTPRCCRTSGRPPGKRRWTSWHAG